MLAGIVLVGLALLAAWKVITEIKYRKEYMAFEIQRETETWNEVSKRVMRECMFMLFSKRLLRETEPWN